MKIDGDQVYFGAPRQDGAEDSTQPTPMEPEKAVAVTLWPTHMVGAQTARGYDLSALDGQTWTVSPYRGHLVWLHLWYRAAFFPGITLDGDGTRTKLFDG